VQASKEQQPDTYFGGLDIEKLKTGKIYHNTEGSLVESEFGFIDEIFDANDFTLRALLSLLNERRLIRGVQNVEAQIHTVIAATNYLRISEVTEAILDRFLFKAIVLPDKDPLIQFKIGVQYSQHSNRIIAPTKKIPYNHLYRLKKMINGLDSTYEFRISAEMLYFTNLVIRHYEFARNRGLREKFKGHQSNEYSDFYISPRTQAKALDLLRALAFLDGRTLADSQDVRKLSLIFATAGLPEETHLFDKSFTAVFNSLNAGNGFEQIRTLIAYESLLEQIEKDPLILQQPLDKTLSNSQLRRSLLDWIKDALQIDHTVQHNKKVLESFLKNLIPVCDEVRELKNSLEKETTKIFQQIDN
jgi:MoxR-like ATPase